MDEITRLLNASEHGDGRTADELLPLVYDDLRRLAAGRLAAEAPGQTLQPTALVHEVWLRVAGENHRWENRRHFYAVAAEAMRRLLVDRARRRRRVRHGGALERVDLDGLDVAVEASPDQTLAVHEALDRLAAEDPIKAELVKLRYFVGLRIPEAAEILGISPTTAKRHWTFARAWLHQDLRQQG